MRSKQASISPGGLSIKRVLASTVSNIIQSAASTYFAKQTFPSGFRPWTTARHSTRPLLLILFGIRSVAPITPSRLRRFSKLVAHCTGRWVAQGRERMIVKERERGRGGGRTVASGRGKGMQSMHHVGERAGARPRRNSQFESRDRADLVSFGKYLLPLLGNANARAMRTISGGY